MPIVPGGFVHQTKIASLVRKATKVLRPDVVRIRYSFGEDWIGAPALFFRVVLSDNASRQPNLRKIAQHVTATVSRELKPEELGLHAYFNFRSVSEQNTLKEESWA